MDVYFDDVTFRYTDVAADTAVADVETGETGNNGEKSGVVGAGKTSMSKDGNGSVVALHGVSFTARRGQVTAIVGPSGSGKSTAVELLAGNLSGYEGCVELRLGNAENGSTQRYRISDLSIESLTKEIAIVTTVVYALARLTLSPPLAATLIIAHLIIGVILPKLFASAVRGIGPELRKESSALDDEMLDDMRGIGEIIRFGQGDARLASIQRRTRLLWGKRVRLSVKNGDFAGFGAVLVMLFTAIAAFLVMTLCTVVSTAADMSEGLMWMGSVDSNAPALVVAFVLLASSFGPTLALSALPANLTQTFASARRLFSLVDEAPAVVEQGSERPEYQGMTMRDVTFGYGSGARISGERTPNGRSEHATGMSPARPAEAQSSGEQGAGIASQPVLEHVSLDVSQQGILGIQGPSGRGKSTMLKLLMRYWDPDSGTISLSDVPLPQVDAGWRRRVQTMMGQETYLFDGTIRENLAIACDSFDSAASAIPDSVLREALAKASALELVDALPNGLDTQVGELGGRLSEGEKQRIGLARMFLRDADLVLFDEPTSRLDAYNESVILGSINDLAERGSAVVLVSHRDSTMRIADRILRM